MNRMLPGQRPEGVASRPRGASILALVLGTLAAGCATPSSTSQPASEAGVAGGVQGAPLPPRVAEFLETAPASAVIKLTQSPWGPNVEVTVGEPYFAASGRQCRKLRLTGNAVETHRALACRADKGWVEQRLVTRAKAVEGAE